MGIELDALDRKILEYLQVDSRRPFLEIARNLKVSGGTVHGRVNRLRELGVIRGSNVEIDYRALGFETVAFVGIRLTEAKQTTAVRDALVDLPEVVELHAATGPFALLVKIVTTTNEALHNLLTEKLHAVDHVAATETFLVLDTPLQRAPALSEANR